MSAQKHQSSQLIEPVIGFIESQGWDYEIIERDRAIKIPFKGKNGNWDLYTQIEQEQFLLFYSILPNQVPQDYIATVAELLTRVNYGLTLGNFEMDWETGEVRYKTSLDIQSYPLNQQILESIVLFNLYTVDQYLRAIMQVIYSNAKPTDTLK